MAMTMTQKILAAHAGLDSVEAGQLILVNLDLVQIGVGGTDSWSQRARPYDQYRLLDKEYTYSFYLMPVK